MPPRRRRAVCKLIRRHAVQRGVRPDAVVVHAPRVDLLPRVRRVAEVLLVQALVPQLAVEAFALAVLRRLARRDPMQLDATLVGPLVERLRGEFKSLYITSSFGFPYRAIAWSSPRVTLCPVIDVSTSSPVQRLLTASTIVSTRMLRPSTS